MAKGLRRADDEHSPPPPITLSSTPLPLVPTEKNLSGDAALLLPPERLICDNDDAGDGDGSGGGGATMRQPTRDEGDQKKDEKKPICISGDGGEIHVPTPDACEIKGDAEVDVPAASVVPTVAEIKAETNDDDGHDDTMSDCAFSDVFGGDLVEVAAAKVVDRFLASSSSPATVKNAAAAARRTTLVRAGGESQSQNDRSSKEEDGREENIRNYCGGSDGIVNESKVEDIAVPVGDGVVGSETEDANRDSNDQQTPIGNAPNNSNKEEGKGVTDGIVSGKADIASDDSSPASDRNRMTNDANTTPVTPSSERRRERRIKRGSPRKRQPGNKEPGVESMAESLDAAVATGEGAVVADVETADSPREDGTGKAGEGIVDSKTGLATDERGSRKNYLITLKTMNVAGREEPAVGGGSPSSEKRRMRRRLRPREGGKPHPSKPREGTEMSGDGDVVAGSKTKVDQGHQRSLTSSKTHRNEDGNDDVAVVAAATTVAAPVDSPASENLRMGRRPRSHGTVDEPTQLHPPPMVRTTSTGEEFAKVLARGTGLPVEGFSMTDNLSRANAAAEGRAADCTASEPTRVKESWEGILRRATRKKASSAKTVAEDVRDGNGDDDAEGKTEDAANVIDSAKEKNEQVARPSVASKIGVSAEHERRRLRQHGEVQPRKSAKETSFGNASVADSNAGEEVGGSVEGKTSVATQPSNVDALAIETTDSAKERSSSEHPFASKAWVVTKEGDGNFSTTTGKNASTAEDVEVTALAATVVGIPTSEKRRERRRLRMGFESPQRSVKRGNGDASFLGSAMATSTPMVARTALIAVSNKGDKLDHSIESRTSIAAVDDNSITTNNSKETLGTGTSTGSSRMLRKGCEQQPQKIVKGGSGDASLRHPLVFSNRGVAMTDGPIESKGRTIAVTDEDNSIITNNSKETLGTAASADNDGNSIATDGTKETLEIAKSAVSPSLEKRRVRRQLRKGGGKQKISKEIDDKFSSVESLTKLAPSKTALFATMSGESIDSKTNIKHDNSIRTDNSKDTLSSAASTVSPSSDKRRERRHLRKGGEHLKSSPAPLLAVSNTGEEMNEPIGSKTSTAGDDADNPITTDSTRDTFSTASTGAGSAEKRRERRKLRRGDLTHDSAKEIGSEEASGGCDQAYSGNENSAPSHGGTRDGDRSITTAATDDDLKEGKGVADSSEKRRERRKLRLRDDHQQQEHPHPPPPTGLPLKLVTTTTTITTTMDPAMTRRLKIADRAAKGIVPIPKALLNAKHQQPNNTIKQHQQLSLFGGTEGSSSAAVTQKLEVEGDNDDTDIVLNAIAATTAVEVVEGSGSPKTPAAAQGTSESPAAMNTPTTPTVDTSSPAFPSQQERLVFTPTNEVEMKLVEEEKTADENSDDPMLSLPNLETTSADQKQPGPGNHEAQRQRRRPRKGPVTTKERVEMVLKSNRQVMYDESNSDSESGDEIEPWTDERGRQIDQDDGGCGETRNAQNVEKRQRSSRFISDRVKSTLVDALENEHRSLRSASAAITANAAVSATTRPESSADDASSSLSSILSFKNVDPEVSKQIARALDRARKKHQHLDDDDALASSGAHSGSLVSLECGGPAANQEGGDAEDFFLHPPLEIGEESLQQQTTTRVSNDTDAAWDAKNDAVSGLSKMTEQQSEALTKGRSTDGSRPLLALETISSDHHHDEVRLGTGSLEVAPASIDKLLSQKERLSMYTSGEGFGVGEDSSIDNDDENESIDSEIESISRGNGDNVDNENVEVGASSDYNNPNPTLFDYEDMNNIIDDANAECNEEIQIDDILFFPPGENDDVPTFFPAGYEKANTNESRTSRWDRNPDAISEVDDESKFNTDSKNVNTDGSAVSGLRLVGSSTVCNSSVTHPPPPPPPRSPLFEQLTSSTSSDLNNDVTPKIGSTSKNKSSFSSVRKSISTDDEVEQQPPPRPPPPVVTQLIKIPPPPPEKLRQWEESKGAGKGLLLPKSPIYDEVATTQDSNNNHSAPQAAKSLDGTILHRGSGSLNYKIHLPKSPQKKKAHSLLDELDLPSHKRMAEKIALARAKAERKFEEEYNNSHHNIAHQHQQQYLEEEALLGSLGPLHHEPAHDTSSENRFFCAGESVVAPLIISGTTVVAQSPSHLVEGNDSAESNLPMPAVVGELVRGAFSPWKIPDRADDDTTSSSIASFTNATGTAVKSISGHHGLGLSIPSSELGNKDDSLNESFEVCLEDRDDSGDETGTAKGEKSTLPQQQSGVSGGGSLTEVLRWLFEEVLGPLTSNSSPIATAFSAFDINTSTTVQADRVLAIANVDESLNIICEYVATQVRMKANDTGGVESSPSEQDNVPRRIISDGVSVSTYDSSSFVTTSSIISEKSKQPSNFAQKAAARIFKRKKDGSEKFVAVDPFEIPLVSADGSNAVRQQRLNADVLAANFVGFLQQISSLAEIPSPYGNDNPFLQSVVHNLATSTKKNFDTNFHPKRERSKTTMQDLVFPNQDMVVAIFQFLWKACCSSRASPSGVADDARLVLSAIEEDNAHVRKNKTNVVVNPTKATPPVLPPSDFTLHQGKIRSSRSTTVRKNNKQRKTTSFAPNKSNQHNPKASNLNFIFPNQSPSPFETAVWNQPSIIVSILSFLGNPVAVCVMKRLNVFTNRVVCENQHVLMRDAVRLGGMSKYVRPSFWLWVTEGWKVDYPIPLVPSRQGFEPHTGRRKKNAPTPKYLGRDFLKLKDIGSDGKWQHVIERDVTRSFGNMPPHKTGARYRQDSIVRALVSFGKEEIMRNSRSYQCAMDKLPEESEAKHFKLSSRLDRNRRRSNNDDSSNGDDSDSGSLTPTDTVSDWGGISPVGSMVSEDPSVTTDQANDKPGMQMVSYESGELLDATGSYVKKSNNNKDTLKNLNISQLTSRSDVSDPVLSGNALTSEMKVDLQNKLRSILHALAARHEAVGYCQGMDYIVAHLLRVLQDTILLREVQRSMPATATTPLKSENNNQIDNNAQANNKEKSAEVTVEDDWRTISSDGLRARMNNINSHSVIVEEVVFGVMDTFFSTYSLQHMYWPELRCLKTCCRVFEHLIKQKLPVLADHFQHYDLNVGLFALGWFQTLFLYLPSMPSTTVCHIWDIWLVERSFKIFFRIGTAILFLSQPTLLNHDDDGMMTYLNTFPDATLMRRDILIPCALQIKITNRMLVEIEKEVTMNAEMDAEHHQFPP